MLLLLSEAQFQSLRPLLAFQPFPHHANLHEQDQELEFVHFLNWGLVSLVVATRNGKTVEVGVVGNEGFIGAGAVVGLQKSQDQAVVQVAASGFRVRVSALQATLSANPNLEAVFSRYAAIQGMQAAQVAACNRLHGVEQRLARRLLIMRDRTNQLSLHITHDALANVLGTDRPSVTLAAGELQRKGAIEYRRGAVTIVHRELLEAATCECYCVLQRINQLLVP
jgi:CRP-like cAMP-binding protein